jgi:hypothetical protein
MPRTRSNCDANVLDDLESEFLGSALEDLARMEPKMLRRRWRTLLGSTMPERLSRNLTLRILAYYAQVQRHGDLDRVSRQTLAEVLGQPSKSPPVAKANEITLRKAEPSTLFSQVLRPGTVLTREHAGVMHRVMLMEVGFSWNGRIYESLSKVAFAITGTRWNGPRFFGLRDKTKAETSQDGFRGRKAIIGRSENFPVHPTQGASP